MKYIKKEKGIALPVTLFALIGLLLSVMLLIRAGNVAITVSGNVGAHTQLSGSNTVATAGAVNWLSINSATLDNNNTQMGYYSSQTESVIDYNLAASWSSSYNYNTAVDSYGNVSQYIITRMCTLSNVPYNGSSGGVQNICSTGSSGGTSVGSSSAGYDVFNFGSVSVAAVFYKIVTRTCSQSCPGSTNYNNQIKNGIAITETIVKI